MDHAAVIVALVLSAVALVATGYAVGRAHGRVAGTKTTSDRAELPRGVVETLAVLRSAGVVLDSADLVVTSSAAAVRRGLVRNHELVYPELVQLVRQVRRDGDIVELELDLKRGPLGRATINVLARVAPLSEDYVLLLVDDRTTQRRVDEVRRDFVANVSHELKTPVGGISLLAEAVLDASDDPEAVQRFARRMKVEADRLTRLVREIVDLSRLQGQDVLDDPVVVDIASVAVDATERSRLLAEAKDISVVSVGEPDSLVLGDRELLTTAISNLIGNAINYSPEGTRVAVRVRALGDEVECAVTDQGVGIAVEEQERVFERFYRVDAARSRATGGTGLGLSIVKHICANHGGNVTVWSREGRGSTFTITLPGLSAEARDANLPENPAREVPTP